MNDKDTGGPAFPVPGLHRDSYNNGMTLRDYFAAEAMKHFRWNVHTGLYEDASLAYEIADAMLKARKS